jgi:hypothetical protein
MNCPPEDRRGESLPEKGPYSREKGCRNVYGNQSSSNIGPAGGAMYAGESLAGLSFSC